MVAYHPLWAAAQAAILVSTASCPEPLGDFGESSHLFAHSTLERCLLEQRSSSVIPRSHSSGLQALLVIHKAPGAFHLVHKDRQTPEGARWLASREMGPAIQRIHPFFCLLSSFLSSLPIHPHSFPQSYMTNAV